MVGDGPEYRLEIPNAKLDFTGTYTIYAKNVHGDAKAIISLQIFAKGKTNTTNLRNTYGSSLSAPERNIINVNFPHLMVYVLTTIINIMQCA